MTDDPEFWSKVRACPDGCWLWQGKRTAYGYGRVARGGKHYHTHRYAWTLSYGPVPDGLCVMHRCDVRACVNPAHLALGTPTDNHRDMTVKGRGRGRTWKVVSPALLDQWRRQRAEGVSFRRLSEESGYRIETIWRRLTGTRIRWRREHGRKVYDGTERRAG